MCVFTKDLWLISRGNTRPLESCPPRYPALTLPWRARGEFLSADGRLESTLLKLDLFLVSWVQIKHSDVPLCSHNQLLLCVSDLSVASSLAEDFFTRASSEGIHTPFTPPVTLVSAGQSDLIQKDVGGQKGRKENLLSEYDPPSTRNIKKKAKDQKIEGKNEGEWRNTSCCSTSEALVFAEAECGGQTRPAPLWWSYRAGLWKLEAEELVTVHMCALSFLFLNALVTSVSKV